MRLCFEIIFIRLKDILHIRLWIQIDKREPCALHLNLQFVPLFNSMEHILKLDVHICLFIWRERFWVGKAVPKPTAEHLAPNH